MPVLKVEPATSPAAGTPGSIEPFPVAIKEPARAVEKPEVSPAPPSPPPAQRLAPGAASAMANDGHAFLRSLLNVRFRAIAKMIPDLESRRGTLPAETYYLPFLLRNELLSEIAAEVSRTQLAADHSTPLIAGTHEWMGIDTTLLHLGRTSATGVFSFKLGAETIDLSLLQGRVASVGSNNARAYCAGAAYNFRAAPSPAISAAVTAHQRDGTPFFVTLARLGIIRDPALTSQLLRTQGVKAIHRAMITTGTRYAFVPRENLPEAARQFALNIPMAQFVMEVLRCVDDWLQIESTTGSIESVFMIDPAGRPLLAELQLSPDETAVMGVLDGRLTLEAVAASAGLALFPTCSAIYRLMKLNIVRIVPTAPTAPEQADPLVEEFLQDTPQSWDPTAPAKTAAFSASPVIQPNSSIPWPKF